MFQTLTGISRELFIAFDLIQVVICAEFAGLFLHRARKAKFGAWINIGWGLVFLLFGVLKVANIINGFYSPAGGEPLSQVITRSTGNLSVLGVIIIFEYLFQNPSRDGAMVSSIAGSGLASITRSSIKMARAALQHGIWISWAEV
jgi:hypothetical protein